MEVSKTSFSYNRVFFCCCCFFVLLVFFNVCFFVLADFGSVRLIGSTCSYIKNIYGIFFGFLNKKNHYCYHILYDLVRDVEAINRQC